MATYLSDIYHDTLREIALEPDFYLDMKKECYVYRLALDGLVGVLIDDPAPGITCKFGLGEIVFVVPTEIFDEFIRWTNECNSNE